MDNQTNGKQKSTDFTFLFVYAVAALMVIIAHGNGGGFLGAYDWYAWGPQAVALFSFSSGFFYKSSYAKDPGKYILRQFKKLILPLYGCSLFYGILTTLLLKRGFAYGKSIGLKTLLIDPLTDTHQFLFTQALWYIPAILIVSIVFTLLVRLSREPDGVRFASAVFVLFLAAGILGSYAGIQCEGETEAIVILRAMYLMPFYAAGYLYRRIADKVSRIPNMLYFTVLFVIMLFLIIHYRELLIFHPSWFKDFYKGPVIPYVIGFCQIAFWLRVGKIMEPVTKESALIRLIADNTYDIVAHHLLGFFLVKCIFAALHSWAGLYPDFDSAAFHTNFQYFYLPGGVTQSMLIYTAAGVALPLIWVILKKKIRKAIQNRTAET